MSVGLITPYVIYQSSEASSPIREVRCKLCGVAIQKMVPDDAIPVRHRRVPGTTTVIQEIVYVLRPTADYAEVTLEMQEPDGRLSLHVTPVCKNCVPRVTDANAGEIFLADVDSWVAEEAHVKNPPTETQPFIQTQKARKVRRVLPRE